jgi:hypothetical protein
MCAGNQPSNVRPRGGLFGAAVNDFIQAKNPTANPIKRTLKNWSPEAPSPQPAATAPNPMSVAMAGQAADMAGATTPIGDAFLGASKQPSTKSGYKVVG